MNLFFEERLQNTSLIRLAAQFFKQEINSVVRFIQSTNNLSDVILYSHYQPPPGKKNYIFDNDEINKVNAYELPHVLSTNLKTTIRYMDIDLSTWVSNNVDLIKPDAFQFAQSLEWTKRGTIDTSKTLINMLKGDHAHVLNLLHLSCTTFCEEQVVYLWEKLSGNLRSSFTDSDRVESRFWNFYLKDNLTHEEILSQCVNRALETNNVLALKFIWPRLSLPNKMQLFNSSVSVSADFIEFYLMQPELSTGEIMERKAFSVLKAVLENWMWHDNVVSSLNSSRPFLTDIDKRKLFEIVVILMESYNGREEVQMLFKVIWEAFDSIIVRDIHYPNLIRLLLLENEQCSKMVLDKMTPLAKDNFLHSLPNPIITLIVHDKYAAVDYLLRHIFKTDKKVAKFKLDSIFRTHHSWALQVLFDGDLEIFKKVIEWGSSTKAIWEQFKTDVLLNENVYHTFKNVLMLGGVDRLNKYFNILFPSSEALAQFKTEVLVKIHAKEIYMFLFYEKDLYENGISSLFKLADEFLDYCFPDVEQRNHYKKKFIIEEGYQLCSSLFYNNLHFELEKILDFIWLNPEEKLAFKRKILINKEGDPTVGDGESLVVSQLMTGECKQFVSQILKECLCSEEEIAKFKREKFLSSPIFEMFEELLHNFWQPGPLQWEHIKNVLLWFDPSEDDVKLLKLKFQEKFLNSEAHNTFFQLLEEREHFQIPPQGAMPPPFP